MSDASPPASSTIAEEQDPSYTSDTENTASTGKKRTNNRDKKELDKHQKKRMRVPTSCSVCRKRKIRCDKTKPVCGACSKSNVSHLCHFEEPPWLTSEDLLRHARTPPAPSPTEYANLTRTARTIPSNNNSHITTGIPVNVAAAAASTASAASAASAASPPEEPSVINGVNISDLPPDARKIFEELTFRVKHLEASIAVHDLSNSYSDGKSNESRPQNSSSNYFASKDGITNSTASELDLSNASSLNNLTGPYYDFDADAQVEFFNYLPFMIKKTRLESHGPFSTVAMMRKDVYLKVLWMYLWKTIEKSQSGSCVSKGPSHSSNDQMFSSCINMVLSRGGKSLTGFLEMRKLKLEQKAFVSELGKSKINLNDLILQSLPNKKTIMVLCFRFFKNVYPFLPFVNENSFFTEIDAIIGPLGFNNDKIKQLHINSKYDYATLGLLLLVLRFGYLSISDEEFDDNPDFKILKTEPIDSKIIYTINRCLYHYNFMRKSYSLKVVQLFLYFKLYYKYCTEDDDVSDCSESQIMLGTIFAMAYNIGFNRDPIQLTKLTTSNKKKPQAQLWRRIWHKLLELDCVESVVLGTPLHCPDNRSYDTPLPLDDQDDDEMDTFITQDFKFLDKKNALYRKICNTCLNIHRPPTVLQIIHLVKILENFIQSNLGSMKDMVNDSSLKPYVKVKRISYLLEIHSLLLSLNWAIYCHFLKINDSKKSLEYLTECLVLSLKIANSMMNLTYNEKYYFGKGFGYFIRPVSNNALSKTIMFLCSFCLNVLHSKQIIGESHSIRYKLFCDLSEIIFSNLENMLQLLDKLSSHQYNFARVVMAFRLFYQQLRDPNFKFASATKEISSFIHEKSHEKLLYHHLHDLTLEDLPKSNFLLNYLDVELADLMEKCQTDLVTILQPAISRSKYSNSSQKLYNSNNSNVQFDGTGSTSFASSGTYYDPINGSYQRKNSSISNNQNFSGSDTSSPNNPSPLTSASINFDNIFEEGNNTKLNNLLNPSFNTGDNLNTAGNYDPNILTNEEYASLFALFEDYNTVGTPTYEGL